MVAARGDTRKAILLVLQDQSLNGYQIAKEIERRSGGQWSPSEGAIYPALRKLEEQGLITRTEGADGKLASLMDQGREFLSYRNISVDSLFGGKVDPGRAELKEALNGLKDALLAVSAAQDQELSSQSAQAVRELTRSIYLDLANKAGSR